MSDLLDLLSILAQIADFLGEIATLPAIRHPERRRADG